MTLPKVHRLKRRQEFNDVYHLGIKRTTPHLTLRAFSPHQGKRRKFERTEPQEPEPQEIEAIEPTRVGISVSQKVSKRAVVRNRIKRQIRAALYRFLPDLAPGWWLVIIVKPNAIQCDYEEFLRELEQLLINAEVLDGH